ncbi:amphi-Trp domain-containing protein [Micromonospora sp. NBC_01796]|uniref:amphi-Trp domain-containing protein n=1 Tax=Micromonospora sp. NBC_01796 TaxID=2975987 RepID=UPI002DDC2E41|nr:amphi-Trp domain-containing protein [Micromonospora sp. NBC_01796]WSA86612.1 amphi-Trp domain-containing protein [Micromonospora sp. NBC_01796]
MQIYEDARTVSRADLAAWLRQLASQLESGGQIFYGAAGAVTVADQVRCELEIERESGTEISVEIEFSWTGPEVAGSADDSDEAETDSEDDEEESEESAATEADGTADSETEPAEAEPAATEPAATEPAATESAEAEPAATGSADAEPTEVKPAEAKPADAA